MNFYISTKRQAKEYYKEKNYEYYARKKRRYFWRFK